MSCRKVSRSTVRRQRTDIPCVRFSLAPSKVPPECCCTISESTKLRHAGLNAVETRQGTTSFAYHKINPLKLALEPPISIDLDWSPPTFWWVRWAKIQPHAPTQLICNDTAAMIHIVSPRLERKEEMPA